MVSLSNGVLDGRVILGGPLIVTEGCFVTGGRCFFCFSELFVGKRLFAFYRLWHGPFYNEKHEQFPSFAFILIHASKS
jgi:hypothetical protein